MEPSLRIALDEEFFPPQPDSVPAMLTPGEHVLRHRLMLDAMISASVNQPVSLVLMTGA